MAVKEAVPTYLVKGSSTMARVEPSADMRIMARASREMFLALIEQGFTEDQAIRFIAMTIGQAASGGSSSDK